MGWDDLGKNAGDAGRLIPDIIGIRKDGTIDVYEIVSKTQNNDADLKLLRAKLERIEQDIPAAQRGNIRVINPYQKP